MAVHAAFAKELAGLQNRDDRFLALIGYDGQLDLALLNVEHLVGDITLLEYVLIFKEFKYRLSLFDFGERDFRFESIPVRHGQNPFQLSDLCTSSQFLLWKSLRNDCAICRFWFRSYPGGKNRA